MKRVYAIEAWCVDCKRCEVACKTAHSASHNVIKAYKVECPEPLSRIHVEGDLMLSFAVGCRHCADPKCVEGCISGALSKEEEDGIVSIDMAQCVGCGTCETLCPFGCVHIKHEAGKGKAYKCDMKCYNPDISDVPACVAACPNNALIYVESDDDVQREVACHA